MMKHVLFAAGIWLTAVGHLLAQSDTPRIAATQPDGSSVVIELPFEPNGFRLSPSEDHVLLWRVERVARAYETRLALVSIEQAEVIKQQKISDRSDIVLWGERYVFMSSGETRTLRVLSLPDLSTVAERHLETVPSKLTMIADAFVEAGGQGRWALPNLEPTSGPWEFLPGSSAFEVPDGWFVDGFVYDQQLDGPIRFCGHPELYASQILAIDQGVPARPVGTRLAPALHALALGKPTTHQHWQYEVVTPASQPLQPGLFADNSVVPDAAKMRRWIRFQIAMPQTSSNDVANTRLLGKVRADLPDTISPETLFQRGTRGIAAGRRAYAVAIANHLFVFSLSDSCVERLPQAPRIVASEFPVVVPADKPTTWPLKLSGGQKLKHVSILTANALRFDAATQSLEVNPLQAREFNEGRHRPISRSVSPNATFEQWIAQIRRPTESLRLRLEQMSKQEIRGIPMAISYRLQATCEDGSEAALSGAIVADLPVELYREDFEKRQATRLARLTPPSLLAAEAAIDIQSSRPGTSPAPDDAEMPIDVAEIEPAASAPSTPDSPQSPVDAAAVAIEPEPVAFVVVEALIYIALSTLIGGLVLWSSCRMHRAGLPGEEHFEPPRFGRVMLVMLTLGVFFAGIESLAVVWGRGAIEIDEHPAILVGIVLILAAGFVRFVATSISIPMLLRLPATDTGEVLIFFWLLVFIPQAALLSAWFAITLT